MQTALYVIWILVPLGLFLLVLWAKLEQIAGKNKVENIPDLFSQAVFVTACSGITYLLDTYLIDIAYASLSPDFIPIGFYKILLLPFVLLLGAKVWGGSKDIMISTAPNTDAARRKKKQRR